MLDAALATGEEVLLADQLTWALDRLPHDGVAPQHVLARFRILRDVVIARMTAPTRRRRRGQWTGCWIS